MLKKNQINLNPFIFLQSKFRNDLEIIDNLIIENISTTEPLIRDISKTLISAGGKRLRPLLCIASAYMSGNGNLTENSYNLAAAIELIHAATLLHDDVIDESRLRRGKETANVIWGNKASILVGDFLFSRAFQLILKTGTMKFLNILTQACSKISEGEVTQLRCFKSFDLEIEDYLEIIECKTATLFAASCQIGALSSKSDEDNARKLYEFGENFGLMYQILDDISDYTDKNRGKEMGDDFREGKITLPILLAYQMDTNKMFWSQCFGDSKTNNITFENVRERLYNLRAFDKANFIAERYAEKARKSLEIFDCIISENFNLLIDYFF